MIHIIMCTYNGEKYIREQLQSIADNSLTEWKLYVSDDGSIDQTKEIVRIFAEEHPGKVEVIDHKDSNGAALHFLQMIQSVSVRMQDEDVIMLSDQDDVWFPSKMKLSFEHMNRLRTKHSNTIPLLVCSDVEVVDENRKQIAASFKEMNHYDVSNLDLAHLMMENKVQGCTTMMNKVLAQMIYELPRKVSMHDAWIGLIATAFGRIDYIETPTMAYRQHTSNVKGAVSYRKIILSQLKNMKEQKYIVYREAMQIKEFIRIYGAELDDRNKKIAEAFATLEQQGFWCRRKNIIRYRMWKTGVVRNLGLMILI